MNIGYTSETENTFMDNAAAVLARRLMENGVAVREVGEAEPGCDAGITIDDVVSIQVATDGVSVTTFIESDESFLMGEIRAHSDFDAILADVKAAPNLAVDLNSQLS